MQAVQAYLSGGLNLKQCFDSGVTRFRLTFRDVPETIQKLALILMALQLLDGYFTSIGMIVYGVGYEGNLIMRHLMEILGPTRALVLAKSLTILLVAFLATKHYLYSWIKHFLSFSIIFYFFAAILPWACVIGGVLGQMG